MHQYILDTKFAAQEIIGLICADERMVEDTQVTLTRKQNELAGREVEFQNQEYAEDFNDIRLQHTYNAMGKVAKEVENLMQEIQLLRATLLNKTFSIRVLAGSLLQIAKQGISIVHGDLAMCPPGRNIGSESLKNVIWQGRNQSMHYEDRRFSAPVQNCFLSLEKNFGNDFSLTKGALESKAKVIVDLLRWQEYTQYETDMEDLLG